MTELEAGALAAKLTISAVGDIALAGKLADKPDSRVFSEVQPIFNSSDLVLANLENPLVRDGISVKGKCTMRGSPEWATILKASGIGVVSLANNHLMDYGVQGLLSTVLALDEAGVKHVGAGKNVAEALAPLILEEKGRKIAVLARSSVVVSSPSYAESDQAGVAFFDIQETRVNISACKREASTVILILHWGLEEYAYPSPEQRRFARELFDAGADIIFGHHPHVLQGAERIGKRLACYSLGNFLFDEFDWVFTDGEGGEHRSISILSKENRNGGILRARISGGGADSYDFIPTRIEPGRTVKIDNTGCRQREFARLCSRLQWPGFSTLWWLYSLRQEWKLRLKPMSFERMKWTNLKKCRLRHFREFGEALKRSGKITAGKSTNPYEVQ